MANRLQEVLWLAVFACASTGERSVMFWQISSDADTVANIRAHRENVTGLFPALYQIDGNGNFVHQDAPWKSISPYLSDYREMGLDVVPLISDGGGVGGVAKLGQNFIDAAVAEALKMGYRGYNFDNELRGRSTESSWAPLVPYAQKWISFLNTFADALHSHNLVLSVDIQGCCGWVDPEHLKNPAGHCAGGFAKYEFVATHCAMYQESHLDRVYGMGTYSGWINGNSTANDTSGHYAPETLFAMANAAQKAIGQDKYGTGTKGGWPNSTFDDAAKNNIRHLRDEMGIRHLAHWVDAVNYYPSQAAWDLWGFFLHDSPLKVPATLV